MTFGETVSIARWTRRIIWQNFVGTIAVDLTGITFAAAGLPKSSRCRVQIGAHSPGSRRADSR